MDLQGVVSTATEEDGGQLPFLLFSCNDKFPN
jgi:hypothetical protein